MARLAGDPEAGTGRESVAPPEDRRSAEPDATVTPAAPRASRPTRTVRGHVRLQGAEGATLAPIHGTLVLLDRDAAGSRFSLRAEVVGGAWSAEVPEDELGHAWTCWSVITDDDPLVILAPRGTFPLPAEHPLEVVVSAPRAAALRVVDARDGRDLDGVDVVWARDGSARDHPGPMEEVFAVVLDARSPISMPPRSIGLRPADVLVSAPGFAWKRVTVDLELGGERLVALEPGGDLEVHVQGFAPDRLLRAGPRLTLQCTPERAPDATAWAGVQGSGAVVLTRLPVGNLHVRLIDGSREEGLLAERLVEIVAARTTSVVLDASGGPRPLPPDIFATVRARVPPGWEPVAAELGVIPRGTAAERPRTEGARRNSAGLFEWSRIPAGPRRLELSLLLPEDAPGDRPGGLRTLSPAYSLVAVHELELAASATLELEVPPPVELEVRLIEASSGLPAPPADLRWSPAGGGARNRAVYDPSRGSHHFLAPAGPLDLLLEDERFLPVHARLEAVAGASAHTLHLEPACGIELTLLDGTTRVALPRDVEHLEGLEGARIFRKDAFTWRIHVRGPGTHGFRPPAIEGYAAPRSREVEVLPGAFSTVTIALTRGR